MKLFNSSMESAKTSFADCTYKKMYCVYVLLVVKLVSHCTFLCQAELYDDIMTCMIMKTGVTYIQ